MTKNNFSNQSQKFFQNDVRSGNHIEGKGLNLQAIANDLKYAQDHCKQIVPLTSLNKDFGNAKAYAVANLIHEMRINEGAKPIGRKNWIHKYKSCGQFITFLNLFGPTFTIRRSCG